MFMIWWFVGGFVLLALLVISWTIPDRFSWSTHNDIRGPYPVLWKIYTAWVYIPLAILFVGLCFAFGRAILLDR